MKKLTWERMGASTGIAFVALVVVCLILLAIRGTGPEVDAATGQEIAAWYVDNATILRWEALMFAVASIALLWFMGSVRSVLRRAEGGEARLTSIAYGAGVLTAGFFLTWVAISAQALFLRVEQMDPALVHATYATGMLAGGFIGVSTFLRAGFLGAVALVAFRHGGLPRWLGWTSAIVAGISLIGGLVILTGDTDSALGGVWGIALLAFLAWTLAASIYLTMRPEGTGPRTTAPISMEAAGDQTSEATAEDASLEQKKEKRAKS